MAGKCPVCGVGGHACGPSAAVTPVDIANAPMRGQTIVSELKEYLLNGETVQLSPEHAERVGATPLTPAAPVTADSADSGGDAESKARSASNKARRTRQA